MQLIDITRTLQHAPVYPGAEPSKIERVSDMNKGGAYNFSLIATNSHAGTHADALCHFLKDNTVSIDQMPLELYYGACRVITVPKATLITKEALLDKIEGACRIIIHGGGESYLSKEAAEYMVTCGVQLIVTDGWSVAPLDNEVEIHSILLGAAIGIVENVTLDHVADGEYILSAFPVKLGDCDGAPVRAVLIQE